MRQETVATARRRTGGRPVSVGGPNGVTHVPGLICHSCPRPLTTSHRSLPLDVGVDVEVGVDYLRA